MTKIKRFKSIISTLKDGNILITDYEQMALMVVNHFTNLFYFAGNVQNDSIVDDTIPTLVYSQMNTILTLLPSIEEISSTLHSLNKSNALGPTGFVVCSIMIIGILSRLMFAM